MFEEIISDQLKENDVCAISIKLVSTVEDKQPIENVIIFTSSTSSYDLKPAKTKRQCKC